MKILILVLCFLCVAGCGQRQVPPPKPRVVYPALNESPPPPMPPDPAPVEEAVVVETPVGREVPDDLLERQLRKEDQIKGLRDYAAKAAPDDPFALSKQEIDALSKVDGLLIQ